MNKLFYIFYVLVIISGCKLSEKKAADPIQSSSLIDPPVKTVNVPYTEYQVNAVKGDTFFRKSGSILVFPPNSFIDKNGNIIQGAVHVKFREFTDPLDIYLAGIPMGYDSAGHNYTFQSAGMCEVLAFADNIPVFVNSKSKPEIYLAGDKDITSLHVYHLDTNQKKWVPESETIITEDTNRNTTPREEVIEMEDLVKPEKANNKSPVIQIVIDPASFKELAVYNNMKFQVTDDEKNFNPNDSNEEWNKVELVKANEKAKYTVKFSNRNKSVSYTVRPVFEGKDYDKALKVFEEKNKIAKTKLSDRLMKEKTKRDEYRSLQVKDSLAYIEWRKQLMRDSLENVRIERMNILIAAKNKVIMKQNRQTADRNQLKRILRGFSLDGFGIMNLDKIIDRPDCFTLAATFKDTSDNELELSNIAVFHKGELSVSRFATNSIQVKKDVLNMIVAVHNGKVAYFNFAEYGKLHINEQTKEQTFIMTILSEKNSTYENMKSILEEP